jgi:hypothetical protein
MILTCRRGEVKPVLPARPRGTGTVFDDSGKRIAGSKAPKTEPVPGGSVPPVPNGGRSTAKSSFTAVERGRLGRSAWPTSPCLRAFRNRERLQAKESLAG